MKKIKLLVGALVLTGSVFAQKATLDNPWSLEGSINYNATTGLNFAAPTVRARYFVNDNIAARVQLGFGDGLGTAMKEVHNTYQNADGSGNAGTMEINRFRMLAEIGAEYHLTGTDRFSPYFGLGINFGAGNSKMEAVDYNPSTGDYFSGFAMTREGKLSTFGATLSAGFDFYVFENVYLGLELGLRILNEKFHDVTTTQTVPTPAGSLTTTTVTPGTNETFVATQAANTVLRLGWRF